MLFKVKKTLAGWLAILALCMPLLAVPSTTEALTATQRPDHITLTWIQDTRTTQTVTWRTAVGVSEALVQYGEEVRTGLPLTADKQVGADTAELETPEGPVLLHSATLVGLKPGMRYRYRVGDGSYWSEIHSFRTAPAKAGDFDFLVFGDSQSTDYEVWRSTAAAAGRDTPEAAFFVNVGDLVDVGQDYGEWEAWFAGAAGLIEKIPAAPVVGNHETYTPERRRFSLPVFFTSQFRLPANGPDDLRGQVYSFDYGEVHFAVLDSQEGEESQFVPDMLEDQRQWLEKDLAATDKLWKIVFMHRPLYGNKPTGINGNLREAFAGIFAQYGVDVVFTAHDHVVARTWPLDSAGNAVPNGQGTVFAPVGRSGTKTYDKVESKDWNEFFLNPVDEPNYLLVKVRGGILYVQAKTQSGELLDEWKLEKTAEMRE